MTSPTRSLAPGAARGRQALRRLVSGDLEEFARSTWGRESLLTRGPALPQGFGDLLDADAVDELVSRRGLRTPFLRVARDGATLAESTFTAGGGAGAAITDQVSDDRLLRLFADGATIVLQGLHCVWPPLIAFSQQLAADLGHPVQANAYVTPPQSRGFDDHYDVHDVFVLQVEGEKRWMVRPPVHPAPLRDQPWTDRRADVEAAARQSPLLDEVLSPGDCLYLPRGYLHAATALGGVSTHLTLGVHTWTRYSLADELVKAALGRLADDEEVRGALALGTGTAVSDVAEDLELVRDRLLDAVRAVAAETVSAGLAGRVRSSQRAAPVGPLAQLRAATAVVSATAGSTTALDDTVLELRPYLAADITTAMPGRQVLRSRAGDLDLDHANVDVVRRLLAEGSLTLAELGADLGRRLLLAGVVVAAP